MNKIDLCLQIATKAHAGQIDKNGEPYILHPLAVGLMGDTDEAKMAGFLHDVVEDCGWTFEQLLEAGVPDDVVAALKLLTHAHGEDYMAYVQRIVDSGNEIALQVKRNDLTHNLSRPNSNEYFRNKYEPALALVSAALEKKDYSYYLYKERFLARGTSFGKYEWYLNGEWVEDSDLSLGLTDSMMGYGDASPFDYIHVSEAWAEKLILNGTAVLEGRVSCSANIRTPLFVNIRGNNA